MTQSNSNDTTDEQPANQTDDLRGLVEDLVEEQTADLREENAQLRERVDDVEEQNEKLRERVDALEEENEDLRERVDDVEDTGEFVRDGLWNLEDAVLGDTSVAVADARATDEGSILDRLDEVEAAVDATEAVESGEAEISEDLTPMEQIARLPEHVAAEQFDNENHRNTYRARAAVRDFFDYARKTPRGYVLKNPDLCRVLTAQEDRRVDSKTGERVMDRIEDLSRETFEHVPAEENRHGEHILVLDDVDDLNLSSDTVVS